MPFVYIYSPDDFVTAPPIEAGAAADGVAPFVLTLRPGAKPTVVEITDDDTVFDEIDATQSITNDIDLDGTTYAAGTTINTAYDLINTTTGHRVTSVHFGGDGYQQGAVAGIASTEILQSGQSYTFDAERTSHQQNNQYADYVACFAHSAMIDTDRGPVAAGDLQQGDLVVTMDQGLQPLRGVLSQSVAAIAQFAPVVFPVGILGNTIEIVVSPQHRMLLTGPRAELLFGEAEVLVPAVFLAEHGLGYRREGGSVRYIHLVFDTHQIIFSGGCPSESFLPSDQTHLPMAVQTELLSLFPCQDVMTRAGQAARVCLRRHEVAALVA
ncbi:Hint domain-containing protein [Sulfitobacter noctilucae]|uniref:Hint domain-containing protein n=1 Tax=Sulfitobacter noctilucae TaxID=1342302 RepID=UPI00046910F1|nr:Hint domain-containing protein [Sulfitobacter noctilucae]